MTELHRHSLQGSSAETELTVPEYAPGAVCAGIAHIVVGGFHRAHQAVFIDDLLGQGLAREWGIVGIGLLPQEVGMRDVLVAQDHLYTAVVKDGDGPRRARVIGSPDDPELPWLCWPTRRYGSCP